MKMITVPALAALVFGSTASAVTPLTQITANLGTNLDKIQSYSAEARILQCAG